MVYESLVQGKTYTYQPPVRKVTYAGRSSYATVAEMVTFIGVSNDSYEFRRPDDSILSVNNLFHIFKYECYDKRPIYIRSNRNPVRYW